MNIYAALSAVMADVDHVAKRDRNEQQRFLFRGVDAVVNAVGPVLRKHHVLVIPQTESVEYAMLTTRNGGQMTSCRVVVTYTFYAEDGSNISSRVAAESFDSGDKSTPKAMSVAFRTALLQALALPTDEPEPDAETYERQAPAPPSTQPQQPSGETTRRMSRPGRPGPITEAQMGLLQATFTELGIKERDERLARVRKIVGREDIGTSKDLTKAEASRVIDSLRAEQAGAS